MKIGTLSCIDRDTQQPVTIVGLSGPPDEVRAIYAKIAPLLPSDYIFAPPELDPAYWRGRDDPRFRKPMFFRGDSMECVEPRLYQCARQLNIVVDGMTIADYDTKKKERPCASCRANANALLEGIEVISR